MEVKILYWDFDSKMYKDARRFSDVCTWDEKLDKYIRKTLHIQVLSGGVSSLYLKAQPSYDQCCGLREIGSMRLGLFNIDETRRALIDELEKHPLFRNVGALTYTRYRHPEYECQESELIKFIEVWPGASAGAWFYNPNSGNMVQQWTLPINQHLQRGNTPDVDEDDDE